MSEVKRYTESCMEGGGVAPDCNGEFVEWKDYEQLRAELAALKAGQGEVVGDWRIDTSAGREILVYKECSVIEGDDARYVLGLILAESRARQPSTGVAGEAVAYVSAETFSSDGTSDIITCNLPIGTKLYLSAPPASAGARLVPVELLRDICSLIPEKMKPARKEIRALLAQSQEAKS